MSYFSTSKVTVFPSAYRMAQPGSKYTSEFNFINIIKSLADRESFVLNSADDFDSALRCVIGGYYFVIEGVNEILQATANATGLWFRICIENTSANSLVSVNSGSVNLDTGGSDSKFVGLEYKTNGEWASELDGVEYKYLHAATKLNGVWKYVNQIRLSAKSVYYDIDNIDSYVGYNDLQTVINSGMSLSGANSGKYISITDKKSSGTEIKPGKIVDLSSDMKILANSLTDEDLGNSGISPVYYDSNTGTIKNSAATVGMAYQNGTTQEVRLTNGKLVEGITIHTSSSAPGTTKVINGKTFKAGDLWFKIGE